MKTTTALLALAAAAEATPMFSKRGDEVFEDKAKMCKGWDLRTAEGVDKLWKETEAGMDLELFINIHPGKRAPYVSISEPNTNRCIEHQNNWLKNLEDRVMGGTDGKSGASGCALIGTTCSPMNNIGCEEQFEKFGTTFVNKNSYWVFQSVRGMHNKFAELHRQFTTETLVSGLKIGQMTKDFGGEEKTDDDMLGWISAAASMGGAIGGLVPGAVCQLSPFLASITDHNYYRVLVSLLVSASSVA